jgi:hypothetical protein
MALGRKNEVRIFALLAKAFHKADSALEGDAFESAAYFTPELLSIHHNIESLLSLMLA